MIPVLTDAVHGARALLGCRLVRVGTDGLRSGIIVETEAYPPDDPACHAYRGPNQRNAAMFGPPGSAYVYRIHRSYCLNIVTGPRESGQAVLVRALAPLEGVDLMLRARRRCAAGRAEVGVDELTNGPGKLCQALDVDLAFDGRDLLAVVKRGEGLYLLPRERRPRVAVTSRIGISQAREAPLRFVIPNNPWLSR